MDLALRRRALLLSYFTVVYNILEGAVAILLGLLAGSPALLGFALDSLIESISGGVMIWRFGTEEEAPEAEERHERRALRLVGWTFLALGGYVLYEALEKLYTRTPVHASLGGIILAAVSLVVMPLLAREKTRVARGLDSGSLLGDAKETLACAWLSAALLLGLGLNAALHWWWADPVAGLIIVFFLWREGLEMTAADECGSDAGAGGCGGCGGGCGAPGETAEKAEDAAAEAGEGGDK